MAKRLQFSSNFSQLDSTLPDRNPPLPCPGTQSQGSDCSTSHAQALARDGPLAARWAPRAQDATHANWLLRPLPNPHRPLNVVGRTPPPRIGPVLHRHFCAGTQLKPRMAHMPSRTHGSRHRSHTLQWTSPRGSVLAGPSAPMQTSRKFIYCRVEGVRVKLLTQNILNTQKTISLRSNNQYLGTGFAKQKWSLAFFFFTIHMACT